MEWKLEEIAEAGCDLEYPSAEKTLKDLISFRDYLRFNDPDEKFIYKPLYPRVIIDMRNSHENH